MAIKPLLDFALLQSFKGTQKKVIKSNDKFLITSIAKHSTFKCVN